MRTIAIIEFFWHGHYIPYLRLYSRLFAEQGYDVAVFCVDPDAIISWAKEECPELLPQISAYPLNGEKLNSLPVIRKSSTAKNVLRWAIAAKAIRRNLSEKPFLVFIPFVDAFILPSFIAAFLNLFFPYRWFGLYLQPKYLRVGPPKVFSSFDFYSIFKRKSCKSVLFLDEGVICSFDNQIRIKKSIAIPDVADIRLAKEECEIERRLRVRAGKRKIVSLFNPAARYKGVLTLLKSAEIDKKDNFLFFFCGEMHRWGFTESEYELLMKVAANTSPNCFFHQGYIENEAEYNRLFKCSSIIFLGFHNFYHSSNSLTKAAAYHIPVIVSKGYCLEERVNKYHIGIAVEQDDAISVANSLEVISDKAFLKNARFDDYASDHSYSILKQKISAILDPDEPA